MKKEDVLGSEAIALLPDVPEDADYINLLRCRIKLSNLYYNLQAEKRDNVWYVYYRCEVRVSFDRIYSEYHKNINEAAKLVFNRLLKNIDD